MIRRFRFWPSTLAVQLIAVTAAAVTLSNIAVAFWFEYGNEQQSAIAANERQARVPGHAAEMISWTQPLFEGEGAVGFAAEGGFVDHKEQ